MKPKKLDEMLKTNNHITHIYICFYLRKSGSHFFMQHLITQLPEHFENIIFINDTTRHIFDSPLKPELLYQSSFYNVLIDKRLIKNINMFDKCKYLIFSLEDKSIEHINMFIDIILTYKIPYTVIYITRDIFSTFTSRLEYIFSKIYYENFNKMIVGYDTTHVNYFVDNIIEIKRELSVANKMDIDYDKLYNKLLSIYKYYIKHKLNITIVNDIFNQFISMIPDKYIISLYLEYIALTKQVTSNIVIFDYNKFIVNNDYLTRFLFKCIPNKYVDVNLIQIINKNIPTFGYSYKLFDSFTEKYMKEYNINEEDTLLVQNIILRLFKYKNVKYLMSLCENPTLVDHYKIFKKSFKTKISICPKYNTNYTNNKLSTNNKIQVINYDVTLIELLQSYNKSIKHVYVLYQLRYSAGEYLLQHLISQLPYTKTHKNTVFFRDCSHYLLNSKINNFDIFNSLFNHPIIDDRLVLSFDSIKNVEYVILMPADKQFAHLNKIYALLDSTTIQYTKICSLRDFINTLCLRIDYCINIISHISKYDLILHNTASDHYITIINFINNIKYELIKPKIDYNFIHVQLCEYVEYYCKFHSYLHAHVLVDDINRLVMMSVNNTMFKLYSDYAMNNTSDVVIFDFNTYFFDNKYIYKILDKLHVTKIDDTLINIINDIVPYSYKYDTPSSHNVHDTILRILKYQNVKYIQEICNHPLNKPFRDFIIYVKQHKKNIISNNGYVFVNNSHTKQLTLCSNASPNAIQTNLSQKLNTNTSDASKTSKTKTSKTKTSKTKTSKTKTSKTKTSKTKTSKTKTSKTKTSKTKTSKVEQ